jgi:hypothetical protein
MCFVVSPFDFKMTGTVSPTTVTSENSDVRLPIAFLAFGKILFEHRPVNVASSYYLQSLYEVF